MDEQTKSVTVCVRMTPRQYERIVQASHLDRRTLSDMLRILLDDALAAKQERLRQEALNFGYEERDVTSHEMPD